MISLCQKTLPTLKNSAMDHTSMDRFLTVVDTAQIKEYLELQKQEIIDFIKSLVKIETPSYNPAAQRELFAIVEEKLSGRGMHTYIIPGKKSGGILYARPSIRQKKRPVQLLMGHSDTVWPKGTLRKMPLSHSNGKIHGPGVFDMKAGISQIVFAIKTIKSLGLETSLETVILINSDEEIGSRESTPIIRRISQLSERIFVLEPPLGLEGKLKTARKGLGRFTITVKGIAAHAGLDPGMGASAIVELSYQIQKLFALNDIAKGITVNVGMIEGGRAANVVAPESKAVIDVRVLTEKDAEEITQKIYSLSPVTPGTKIEIDGGMGRPPMEKTDRNQKLWALAHAAGRKINIELEEETAGGGSDGNTSSLYAATLDGLGTVGDGAHAVHEFIYLDKFIERTLLLILLLTAKSLNNIGNA